MKLTPTQLQTRARKGLVRLERGRRDPRYARVLGRLRAAGLLLTNFEVADHKAPIGIAEALWVGELEPRVLELLPALVVKTPAMFEDVTALPADLAETVRALRRGDTPADFRGIPGRDIGKWLPNVGRRQKLPTCTKAFRFTLEDLKLLRQLSGALGVTETDVVRRGLRSLAAKELLRGRVGGSSRALPETALRSARARTRH